jgi:hypothetical protein
MWMYCDIFAATRLLRGRLLTSGHLSSRHPVVSSMMMILSSCCGCDTGFQQCKSFVEMCTVRCFPLWNLLHCPMGTVPRVLVWRTASPAQSDFVRLSSGAAPVVVRLVFMYFPPSSSVSTVAGCLWSDPVGRDLWGGKYATGGMSEDNNR